MNEWRGKHFFITDESRESAVMNLHKTVVSIHLIGQPYNTDLESQPTHKE